jgi:hypothetical protein
MPGTARPRNALQEVDYAGTYRPQKRAAGDIGQAAL